MLEPRALVVEHDASARVFIEARLRAVGFVVTGVDNGRAALQLLQRHQYILLVADLWLDEFDGIALLQSARALDPYLHVVLLTARATLDTALKALNGGAVGYLLKPLQNGELEQFAMTALARRTTSRQFDYGRPLRHLADTPAPTYRTQGETLVVGPLQIELRRHSASLAGRPLHLSPGEFALLTYLARHEDEVIAIPAIAQEVLGYPCSVHEARELIKARIHKLRQKLESDPAAPRLVHCVRGAGYMLSAGNLR